MEDCFNGISIPEGIIEPCGGEYKSTDCILSPIAITYLGLPENASQTQINLAIQASLRAKDELVDEIDGSETKLSAGDNITITGDGTAASPYVVTAIAAAPSVDSRPYKVYTALITQQNTSAPTVIVLENTIGSISLVYNSVGYYSLSSVGLFTTDKTVGFITLSQGNTVLTLKPFTTNLMTLLSFSGNGTTFINDAITKSSIEIRVYN